MYILAVAATEKLGNSNVLYYKKKKKEFCRAKTLSNAMFLLDVLSDATKTSEGKVVFNFGI